MTSHRKNLLSDPEFLDRATAGDVLRDALNEPSFVKIAAVADSRGNDMADPGTAIADLKTLNYYELINKYGREVADNRAVLQRELESQFAVRSRERTVGEKVIDTGLAGAAAVTSLVGGVGAAALGVTGALNELGTGGRETRLSEAATFVAEKTAQASGFFTGFQSDTLEDKAELIAIEADLDEKDAADRMNRKIAAGANPMMAEFERVGEGVLDFGERFFNDGAVASNMIAGALGSVWPSAKMAQAGQALAKNLAARTTSKTAQKAAGTVGSALGIGVAEASGTFQDTSNFVMGLTEAEMFHAPEYIRLRSEGMDHEKAQRITAASTATEASARQLPQAAILGLVAARFNANPIKTFRGKGVLEIFREVGIQAFEEGGQGLTGTLSTNLAVSNQINEDTDIGAGLGAALGEGIFAGIGMAGILAVPGSAGTAARSGVRGAVDLAKGVANAARSDTAASILSSIGGGASDVAGFAGQGLDAAGRLVGRVVGDKADLASRVAGEGSLESASQNPITDAAKVAASKVRDVVTPLAEKAAEKAKDLADRPNKKSQTGAVEAADKAVELSLGNETIVALRDVMTGLVETRVNKMSDEDINVASQVLLDVKRVFADLDPATRAEVITILSSKDIELIGKRRASIKRALAESINLNETQDETTEVTLETTAETLEVAKTNPTSVNPDHIKRILEQRDHGLADEDVKSLEVAAEAATLVGLHQAEQVAVSQRKSDALSEKPAYNNREAPKVIDIESTSRSIQVEGFTDAKGNRLRSVNEYMADILEGLRSPDGNVADPNTEKGFVNVDTLIKQFAMFVEHMSNKTEALNLSEANGKDGKGTNELFRSLVGGRKMVPAGTPGGAQSVFLHRNSPKSVAAAEAIANDARIAAEVFNLMVRNYPEKFPGGEVSIPTLNNPNTPAVEASADRSSAPSEAKPETQAEDGEKDAEQTTKKEETPDTTAVVEPVSPEATTGAETVQIKKETDNGDAQKVETEEVTPPEPTEAFSETFDPAGKEVGYESGNDILNLLNVGTNTTQGYRNLAKRVFTKLMAGANKRLQTVIWDDKDGRTVAEALQAGKKLSLIRDFKNTMLVDPETGEYDPDLLSIATVAVIDWLSSVKSTAGNKNQRKETLELLGVNLSELNSEDYLNIMNGVSPRLVSETLAKQIIRMWNVKVNPKSQMVDARGAAEGLVKELLTVLVADFDFISIHEIPTVVGKGKNKRPGTTSTINVKGLKEIQQEIGLLGENSVQKLLAPEESKGPSIGEKIKDTPTRNRRGTVKLSKKERKAIKVQQDTPHLLAKGITGLIGAMGFEVYKQMQGWKSVKHLAENHPLRNSIEGKNLSIERDWDDAHSVTDALQGDNQETPVYFRIDITKVGRHQHSGINSQNNKTLRVMVSPTGNTLDMTNQDHVDGFWLTVAQSSGIFKVENILHEKILSEIQGKMIEKYGAAIALVETYLDTGKLDRDALFEATGEVEMDALNSIFAVASLNNISRKTNALTSFHTTIGFELDGKTDGPAHMLNNFGQGLLTKADYMNFQRVGMFLGTLGGTLNKFFSDPKNKDLYNVASQTGQNQLYSEMAQAGPALKASLYASARFAARFGDFEISDVDGLPEMTRNATKNPMTKTVYGAGLFGVAQGISEEMVIKFYSEMIDVPKGAKASDYLGYPELEADFELLFETAYPKNVDWSQNKVDTKSMDAFVKIVTEGIGDMIASAAKTVIGDPITRVNDLLVFITNVQTEFMILLYDRRLLELAEKRASQAEGTEGWIARHKTTGKGIRQHLMVSDFKALDEEIGAYGPTYSNGVQTLAIGAISPNPSNQELSSTMEGKLQMKSNMNAPEVARVKAIPYLTQGRGDAMVLNEFYSANNAPNDTFAVHDGIYVPISKIKEYSKQANEAVMKNWDRDVLGDVVSDFEGFAAKVGSDVDLFKAAMQLVNDYRYKTTTEAKTGNKLMQLLREAHRQNQARKDVNKVIPLSVDHLAGAGEAATRGPDVEMDLQDINELISDKLNQKRPAKTDAFLEEEKDAQNEELNDRFRRQAAAGMRTAMNEAAEKDNTEIVIPTGEPKNILVTDTTTILETLLASSNRLTVKKTVKVLASLLQGKGYKVVISNSVEDLAAQYDRDHGEGSFDNEGLAGALGWTDVDGKVMYILSNTHETLVHEMIHLATFSAVEAHYDGSKTNAAVPRLEALMEEFLAIDFSDKGRTLRSVAAATKRAIIEHKDGDTAFQKAAALNEFMAWTLATASLVKDLQGRETSVIKRMAKAALILIKRVMGTIPTNMYDNILFNTVILGKVFEGAESKIETPVDNLLIDEGDGGDGNNNDGDEVTPSAANHTNFWIDLMKAKLATIKDLGRDEGKEAKQDQFKRYQKAAFNAVTKLDFGGFTLTAYQQQTFRAIHLVLATEMRLNTQSSVALNKVFEYVTTNLTPEMLGEGRAGQERYSAVRDLLGDTKNDEGVSDAIAVLLALSQTSKLFREALDQLPIPEKDDINDGTFNMYLTTATAMMMQKAIGTIDTSDKGAVELLDVLAKNLIREDVDKEFSLLRKIMGSITEADKFFNGAFSQLAERVAEKDREISKSDSNVLVKLASGAIAAATTFLDADKSAETAELAKRVTHMGTTFDQFSFIREMVTEIVGTDKTNAEVVAILDRTNTAVSAIRQNLKEGLPVVLQDAFKTSPDAAQWKIFHRILGKLDFAGIFDRSNPERAFDLLTDNSLLSSETSKMEVVISRAYSKKVAKVILEKSRQAAAFMNLKGAGHQLWKNAYAINKLAGEYDETMTTPIDTLISLYALEIASGDDKAVVAEMYDNDPEAVTNLVTYVQALNKEEDLKIRSEEAQLAAYKGWIPNLVENNKQIIVKNDNQKDDLLKRGWIRVGDYKAESKWSFISYGIYVTSVRQGGNYSQGVLQQIQGTYRGVNSVTGLSIGTDTSSILVGEQADDATDELNRLGKVDNDMEALIPVHDADGKVNQYERSIDPDMVEQYTQPRSNMALMLGAWAGRQVEELMANQYNNELIVELKRIWGEVTPGDEGLFVDISDPKLKDPIFKEAWAVIPPETKAFIRTIFGEKGGFMVRKDMVNLSLGYPDPSIMDIWSGKTRLPEFVQDAMKAAVELIPGNQAVAILSQTEEAVQSTVATAKDLIVVRSLIVPYMNTQANVFQLATRGVGLKAMRDGYRDKFVEIERYNENEQKRIVLRTQIALAGGNANKVAILEQQVEVLRDEDKRMSIAPLIEAGQYKNISEGITDLDVELTSGRLGAWVENQMNKLPGPVQVIAKQGLLSKDTAIYKMANKAVQYGDFLAKAIMYDHLREVKGLGHTEALKKINEEFINFSVLPGRTRTGLESIGATWFMSFKIRAMKVSMNIMRENPMRALITLNTGVAELGSVLEDDLISVIQDGRIGSALGWDMLFQAPDLNPYVQMWDWS